jgi:hypothetical protein
MIPTLKTGQTYHINVIASRLDIEYTGDTVGENSFSSVGGLKIGVVV